MRNWNTPLQQSKLEAVKVVLEEYDEYKPLTLRTIYYRLVGRGIIDNNLSQYQELCNLLVWAREAGEISWEDIEDRTRRFYVYSHYINIVDFIESEIEGFLNPGDYKPDLQYGQPRHIEVWVEKEALSGVFISAAFQYGVSVLPMRGYGSATILNDYVNRLAKKDKEGIILYFGDFDPSGRNIFKTLPNRIERIGVSHKVGLKWIALTEEQINKYKLPVKPEAIKLKDTRTAKHVAQHGYLAVELDALEPAVLESMIEEAIINELDANLYNAQVDAYQRDKERLEKKRPEIERLLQDYIKGGDW